MQIARTNAALNGVAGKTLFLCSDSYEPYDETERALLDGLTGGISFVLANPPAMPIKTGSH